MYTAFHFASELKKDTPKEVIEILDYMASNTDKEPEKLPEHNFFKCSRWKWLFTMDSCYFDADTHSTFRYDIVLNGHYLTITSNLKNYDNEIKLFVDWISPYLAKNNGDFLGYSRYEENEEPTLIYYQAKDLA